jgi:putative oxidoreductase
MSVETKTDAGPLAMPAVVQDFLLLVGRVLLGWIFVQSGWRKLMDMEAFITTSPTSLVKRGVPGATFWGWIGAPLEFVGGLLILIGCATRYAALAILIFTIAATLIGHRYWEFTNPAEYRAQHTQFFKNVSMMGGTMVLMVAGAGRWALDWVWWRKR